LRALFIGRFNPPHWGHFEALKYILNKSEISQVIIAIGSAQESFKLKNPFTSGERFEMLLAAIKDEKIATSDSFFIVPLPDINNFNQWFAYVQSMLPSFKLVYSNNPTVHMLVKSFSTKKCFSIPFKQRKSLSSTEVRNRIIKNKSWEELVPPSINRLIKKFDGINRLQSLNFSDK
jgi:nicotinamide-nucleotide adenylyltransferase